MDVVHAHREKEGAAVLLPELEDRLERIVAKRGDVIALQFPDGQAEVAAIREPPALSFERAVRCVARARLRAS